MLLQPIWLEIRQNLFPANISQQIPSQSVPHPAPLNAGNEVQLRRHEKKGLSSRVHLPNILQGYNKIKHAKKRASAAISSLSSKRSAFHIGYKCIRFINHFIHYIPCICQQIICIVTLQPSTHIICISISLSPSETTISYRNFLPMLTISSTSQCKITIASI